MLKIFITGKIHSGKTTVIQKIISQLNVECYGIRTISVATKNPEIENVYIVPLHFSGSELGEPVGIKDNKNPYPIPCPKIFNERGVKLVEDELKKMKRGSLFVIDELGSLEKESHDFVRAISKILDNHAINLLCVVKINSYFEQVIKDKNFEVATVTESNRNDIPAKIIDEITSKTSN